MEGRSCEFVPLVSKINRTRPLCTVSYNLQVFLKAGWVRRCKSINPGSLPTVVLSARCAIWTQATECTNGDGQQRCLICWGFGYGMWCYLVGPVRPDVSQNIASLSSSVERSSRTPVTGKGKGRGTIFFWIFRRH